MDASQILQQAVQASRQLRPARRLRQDGIGNIVKDRAREAVEEVRSRTRQLEEFYVHAYEEAQSRLRLSCTCKEMTRPLTYPLTSRILELASAFGLADDARGFINRVPKSGPTLGPTNAAASNHTSGKMLTAL